MEKPRVEKPRPHEFDVFLSHKFVVRKHAPITLEIYEQLTSSGLKVWMDKHEMGHDMVYSMKHGIARSGCVVALMTTAPTLTPYRWARSGTRCRTTV